MSSDVLSRIVNRALLIEIGGRALYIIKQRTLRGEFLPGSTGTSQYSTTPAPLPFGALQKAVQRGKAVKALVASGEAVIYTNMRSKIAWILLKGGYKKLRELAGRETDHVTLNWSGRMMRNLKIVRVDTAAGMVTLGFDEESSEKKASYHQTLGAGRSRKTHKFLGLTEAEVRDLGEFAQQLIGTRLPSA